MESKKLPPLVKKLHSKIQTEKLPPLVKKLPSKIQTEKLPPLVKKLPSKIQSTLEFPSTKINLDVWIQIALELNDRDLLALCTTSKYFNEKICNSDRIWLIKLKKYDTIKLYFEYLKLKPRELYNLLKGLTLVARSLRSQDRLINLYIKKELNSSGKQIIKIPKEIKYLSNLEKLYLNKNKIEKIPDTLPNSLQILYLAYNKIEKIPDTLPNSLQELSLNNNEIETIPDTLPSSLQLLDLRDNKIKEIPDTLPNSLQELSLSNNEIETIPDTLPSSLQILDLDNNKIKEIPSTLPASLKSLYLYNNQIKEIPEKYKNIIKN